MACSKCGDVCGCPGEPPPALPTGLSAPPPEQGTVGSTSNLQAEPGATESRENVWRDELAVRLQRYRARRKAVPPRYPSLRLPFDAVDPCIRAGSADKVVPPSSYGSTSNHALALDATKPEPSTVMSSPSGLPAQAESQVVRSNGRTNAKIIEFPRFAWGPPPPPLDQLAEPVADRPRILEVPETEPPPPALGGITIEPVSVAESEKRAGIDTPLHRAALGRRLVAGFIDGLIIAAASAFFGYVFWKIAAIRPPQFQLVGLAAVIPSLLWAAYQYLLIVYAANTPGLMVVRLELKRFDGTSANRRLRRWRVLASWLSAASLGMGYAWVLLDEDALCWHDRITRTYLAPRTASAEK